MDRFLVPDPDLSISPVINFPESSIPRAQLPSPHRYLRHKPRDDDVVPGMRKALSLSHRGGLTESTCGRVSAQVFGGSRARLSRLGMRGIRAS
jgi:hypothetical protein